MMNGIPRERLKNLLCMGIYWLTEEKGEPVWVLIPNLLRPFVEIGELTEEQSRIAVEGSKGKQDRLWIKGKADIVTAHTEAVPENRNVLFLVHIPRGKCAPSRGALRKESDPRTIIGEREFSLTRPGFAHAKKQEELSLEYQDLKVRFLAKVRTELDIETIISKVA